MLNSDPQGVSKKLKLGHVFIRLGNFCKENWEETSCTNKCWKTVWKTGV